MAKLRAAECRKFIDAVVEKAGAMGVPVSIAVVGPEGHLIAVERMDEAGFITPETAIAKAFTVAAFRSMSPRFPDGLVIQQWFKERNPQLLVSLAAMTNGRIAASGGSAPGRSRASASANVCTTCKWNGWSRTRASSSRNSCSSSAFASMSSTVAGMQFWSISRPALLPPLP